MFRTVCSACCSLVLFASRNKKNTRNRCAWPTLPSPACQGCNGSTRGVVITHNFNSPLPPSSLSRRGHRTSLPGLLPALVLVLAQRFLGHCGGDHGARGLMEVYRDFGVHNMFASSLIQQHAAEDERFSHEKLYKEGKHYPRPMRYDRLPGSCV